MIEWLIKIGLGLLVGGVISEFIAFIRDSPLSERHEKLPIVIAFWGLVICILGLLF